MTSHTTGSRPVMGAAAAWAWALCPFRPATRIVEMAAHGRMDEGWAEKRGPNLQSTWLALSPKLG